MKYKVSHHIVFGMAIVLLLLSWANINSGFWGFKDWDHGFSGLLFALRSALPYALTVVGLFCYWVQDRRFRTAANPAWWLMIYGVIVLFSSVFSPNWFIASYWGLAYLMGVWAPAAFFIFKSDKVPHPENILIYTTWGVLAVYIAAMFYMFGSEIMTTREILSVAQTMDPEFLIRSSGLSRFFGVFAVILSVWLLHGKSYKRLYLLLPFVICLQVVYQAQSRGAMIALGIGMLFILFVSRTKWVALMVVMLAVGGFFALHSVVAPQLENTIVRQFRRGQSNDELVSMTGRVRAYQAGFREIANNPILGRGNWADRMVIGEHVHNSYLQAAMNGGLLAFVPYLASWVIGLLLFFHIYPRRKNLSPQQDMLFLQCAGVMIFFFFRAIPETTTASFSVDLLVMVPVFYFLAALYFNEAKNRPKRMYHVV